MIFIQNADGTPLMPSNRPKAIRQMLDAGDAVVMRRTPFTVKLTRQTDAVTQPLILGIDPGATIGLAVIQCDGTPVFLAELATRSHDIPELMEQRAAARRQRRAHRRQKMQRRAKANGTAFDGTREYFLQGRNADKERYAPLVCKLTRPALARINNRKNKAAAYRLTPDTLRALNDAGVPVEVVTALETLSETYAPTHRQNEFLAAVREAIGDDDTARYKALLVKHTYSDWIAPTVEHLLASHQRIISQVCALLPVTQIVVEYASFDIHKILNPEVEGVAYQQGTTMGYENVKQYVLDRDGHCCQRCKKPSAKRLHVHHLVWRRNGGNDTHRNLITVCNDCHNMLHTRPADNAKFVKQFPGGVKRFQKTTIFNSIMPRLYDWLRQDVKLPVKKTYGYLTKLARKTADIEKGHALDAYVIACSGASEAMPHKRVEAFPVTQIQQERRHDRQRTTRVEDRKYQVFDADKGKYVTVAKNRARREGQADLSLEEWREQHGHAAASGLRVLPAQKPQKSDFADMKKGALVEYQGKTYVLRGFASYGKSLYLGDIKPPIPAKHCKRIVRNSGMIWHGTAARV